LVEPADGVEYYIITLDDPYPAWLPKDHRATCYGEGLINSHAVENLTVEQRKDHAVVRVFEPDKQRQAEAAKGNTAA
jgi:hypothetical protein